MAIATTSVNAERVDACVNAEGIANGFAEGFFLPGITYVFLTK
jgi:hypothetical protein